MCVCAHRRRWEKPAPSEWLGYQFSRPFASRWQRRNAPSTKTICLPLPAELGLRHAIKSEIKSLNPSISSNSKCPGGPSNTSSLHSLIWTIRHQFRFGISLFTLSFIHGCRCYHAADRKWYTARDQVSRRRVRQMDRQNNSSFFSHSRITSLHFLFLLLPSLSFILSSVLFRFL